MKLIREKILPLLLTIAMVVGVLQGIPVTQVYAASTASVSIGLTDLKDGKYYTAKTGEDPSYLLVNELDAAPTDGTPYLYYENDVINVNGNVSLNCTGPSTLTVSGGAITIAGSGSLSLSNSSLPVINMQDQIDSLVLSGNVHFNVNHSGSAPAIYYGTIQTQEGYSGNINIHAIYGSALSNMNSVNLETTGDINISNASGAPTIDSYNSVSLTGKTVDLKNTGTGSLVYARTTASITAMEGNFELDGDSAPTLIAPDGVTLSTPGDIRITCVNAPAVSGNLTITKSNNVTMYNSSGSLVTGNITILESNNVTLQSKTPFSELDITATGNVTISLDSSAPTITASASINTTGGSIKIFGKGNVPVIGASSLTLHAKDHILVQRTDDTLETVPVISVVSQSLTSDTGLIIISGKGTNSITKDGNTIDAIFGGDVSSSQLNLYGFNGDETPTERTLYLAGNGYLLFTPAQGDNSATLLMDHASMEVDENNVMLITLPAGEVTIDLSGENKLTARSEAANGAAFGIMANGKHSTALTITSSNSGTLNIETSIASNGMVSNAIGYLGLSLSSLAITGNASVIARANVMGSPINPMASIGTVVEGNLTVGDNASFSSKGNTLDVLLGDGNFNAKTFDGTIGMADSSMAQYDITIYGTQDLANIFNFLSVGTMAVNSDMVTVLLNIPTGSKLTIPAGKTLIITDLSKLTNNGMIENNGTVILPSGTTVQQIKALNLTGTGIVKVVREGEIDSYDIYTNNGDVINLIEGGDLTLTDIEVPASANKGYTWTKSGEGTEEVWTLTLDNNYISGSLNLPDKKIVIHNTGNTIIRGAITTASGNPCDITIRGSGSLIVENGLASNGGDVIIEDGIQVTFNDVVDLSDGVDGGTLHVQGDGTTLGVSSSSGNAIIGNEINVKDNASLITSAEGSGSIGVMAHTGVTVTGGANLTTGCDYGVYITNGKLLVDDSSKLTTNGSVAPFCIVDTTSSKTQKDVLSLPGIPAGTQIASVQGVGGKTYWSLVPIGGSLSVSNEAFDPVTLSGAVTKILSFYKVQKPNQPDDPNPNGNDSNGTTNVVTSGTITKVQQSDSDSLIVDLNNTEEELKNILFTSEELNEIKAGQNAEVLLSGTTGTVSEQDKKLAQMKLEGLNPGLSFELSLYKQIGNKEQIRISNTGGKTLNISITIPEALRNSSKYIKRTYYLISKYDGVAKLIKGTYDPATHQYTFDTKYISAFIFGYKDSLADGIQTTAEFKTMRLRAKAYSISQVLHYAKVSEADGYFIYGAQCGANQKLKKLADVSKNTTKYTHSKLKKETSYKYQVKAYKIINGKKEIIAVSKVIYSTTEGKVYSNPVKVITNVSNVTLNKGKTKTITSKVELPKNKKMKSYTAAVQYESTDKKVATVTSKGVIKAVGKGTCYVYVYAQNGVYKQIKVTVK